MIDLFIIAGESSGDLHGAHLLEALLKKNPHLQIAAVSGPEMRKFPIQHLFSIEDLHVMGFIDVLKALPRIMRMFFLIRNKILSLKPKKVLMIDYAEFNLKMGKSLKKKGFQGKLIQYICPTVWAWRQHRTQLMVQNLDQLFTLFPFEKKWFANTPLKVEYVGHPLVFKQPDVIRKNTSILALFPGSRLSEIQKNFPIQIKTAIKLLQIFPELKISLSIAHPRLLSSIQEILQKIAPNHPIDYYFPEDQIKLFESAKLALATSGTITLQLGLYNVPTIVHFAISPLDLWIAQKVFKINLRFYCIVNILLEKETFPELFGPHFTEERLLSIADQFWRSKELQEKTSLACQQLPFIFGSNNPSEKVADLLYPIDF